MNSSISLKITKAIITGNRCVKVNFMRTQKNYFIGDDTNLDTWKISEGRLSWDDTLRKVCEIVSSGEVNHLLTCFTDKI